jgi:DNA-binding winged helix-turn-helix (wHTH) protein
MKRVRFGECVLDSDTRQLFVRGEAVHLSPKAFQFLEMLLESRPKALSKSEIHERLWPGTFVSDGTLASLLVEVRSATGDSARNSRFVRTVHRFGYAFSGIGEELREGVPAARPEVDLPTHLGESRDRLQRGSALICGLHTNKRNQLISPIPYAYMRC